MFTSGHAVIGSGTVSSAASPVPRRGPGMLLTKRRPIDFGLVATCLCRLG
jgi:hypothetical protein